MKLGREDFKKKKELDELRKLGAAPAAVDSEGFIINPHIPQYMSEAPWYLSDGTAGLKHQRLQQSEAGTVQKPTPEWAEMSSLLKRVKGRTQPQKWQKGSCANCGSLLHKTKECVERTRKRKAKYSKTDIVTSDHLIAQRVEDRLKNRGTSYDAKRDRWSSFDMGLHQTVLERHEKLAVFRRSKKEEQLDADMVKKKEKRELRRQKREQRRLARRKLKEQKRQKKKEKKAAKETDKHKKAESDCVDISTSTISVSGDSSSTVATESSTATVEKKKSAVSEESEESSSDFEFTDSESESSSSSSFEGLKDAGAVIHGVDEKTHHSVRNLRLREDTAKYLLNYDLNSAYYDPKTRSMRADPFEGMERESREHRGDNAVVGTGDASKFGQMRSFVWDKKPSTSSGKSTAAMTSSTASTVIPMANPTLAEKIFADFESKKDCIEDSQKAKMIAVYGDASLKSSTARSKVLLLGQSEDYREYGRDGKVLKGLALRIPASKYIENEWPGNHRSVFGSHFDLKTKRWGFACCRQTLYNSYCTALSTATVAKEAVSGETRAKQRKATALRVGGGIGVKPPPKERVNSDKKVNVSGYVSTKGFVAPTDTRKRALHSAQSTDSNSS